MSMTTVQLLIIFNFGAICRRDRVRAHVVPMHIQINNMFRVEWTTIQTRLLHC